MANPVLDALPRIATDDWPTMSEEAFDAVLDGIEANGVPVRLTLNGKDGGVMVPIAYWERMMAALPPEQRPSYEETEDDRRWKEAFRASRGALKDIPEIDV